MIHDPHNLPQLIGEPLGRRALAAVSAEPECPSDDHAMMSGSDKETLKIGEGKPGPGRPPGLPNKATRALKAAILDAFEKVGGEAYLVRVAQEDPKTFCTLLGKVLPMQLAGDPDNPLKSVTRVEFVIVSPEDRSTGFSKSITSEEPSSIASSMRTLPEWRT
jgi:hypothetical protein